MVSSINSNQAASRAQFSISQNSDNITSAVARLSSGNRIVKASDDVAGLSIGTSLRTSVSTLRVAKLNTSLGSSLLQVADGALAQVTEILQRQKAIATQAGSGSLGATERSYLNQEFQALTSEIDRLVSQTNFNGVQLLDGALSTVSNLNLNDTNATQSEIRITATTIAAADTLILNGVTLTAAASPAGAGNYQHGTTIEQTLDNLVAYLNKAQTDDTGNALSAANKLLISRATYAREGNTLVITSRAGGDLSEFFRVDALAANNGTSTVTVATGKGAERLTTTNSLVVANIDTDISSTSTSTTYFADAAITFDGVTIATVATGDTLRGVLNKVNANTSTTGISAFITGTANAYVLNFRTTATGASGAVVNTGNTGLTFTPQTANTLVRLAGGGTTGLGQGSVIGVGNTGGSFSVLTDQTQQFGKSVITFPEIAAGDLTTATNFGTTRTITIEGQAFTFTQTAATAKSQTEIKIGDTLQETLDNAVTAINSFSGAADVNYAFAQIEARREGNSIIISNKLTGNALDQPAGTLTVATSLMTGASASSTDLSNAGNNTGIDTKGVMNADFIGTISGFGGSLVSANKADLTLTVGSVTYTAKNVTTNPTSDTDVRFISETGGYFDVKLRANQGVVVNTAADVNTFAQKLDAAFSGVTFVQTRDVSSYSTTGNLLGSSINMQSADFSDVKLSDVKVTAPSGSNASGSITFTINGEDYTTQSAIGTQLGAYSITRFVSATDSNKFIEFRNGATALSVASAEDAAELEASLKVALGVAEGASSLSFQVGTASADALQVSISNISTDSIFNGVSLNVLTKEDALVAGEAIDNAIRTVTAVRADVGALQSRFNFAAANIDSTVQNQDAARGELLDTDIASESTNFAVAQVKLQAGISTLAQANQQLQSLLKLIG